MSPNKTINDIPVLRMPVPRTHSSAARDTWVGAGKLLLVPRRVSFLRSFGDVRARIY